MSLTSIPLPSFNTLANCAAAVYAIEAAFRMILKNKFITVFPDNSYTGRAIHQCLDISQYVLGAAFFLVPLSHPRSLSQIIAQIAGIALVLCKLKFYRFGCVKAPGFNDRKLTCIDLILANLRSLNRGSFHVSRNGKI
jgi:hypothetical protein